MFKALKNGNNAHKTKTMMGEISMISTIAILAAAFTAAASLNYFAVKEADFTEEDLLKDK
jgi:hypothetical protein